MRDWNRADERNCDKDRPRQKTMTDRYSQWALRIRVPAGFAVVAIFLLFARPTPESLLRGAGVALLGIGLRAASAGWIEKNRRLATGGPYAHTRNPLYLGSALAAVGFCLAAQNGWLWLVIGGFFAAVYWPVIRAEEKKLYGLFPDDYPAYAAAVPLLFPRVRPWKATGKSNSVFDFQQYLRNHEFRALGAYALVVLLLGGKIVWNS
jgi:protein-S-isoprenylcysteine O-methyltransferase Ste14